MSWCHDQAATPLKHGGTPKKGQLAEITLWGNGNFENESPNFDQFDVSSMPIEASTPPPKFQRKRQISRAALRRCARQGGVKRMNRNVEAEMRTHLQVFLKNVIEDGVMYMERGGRKRILPVHIMLALKNNSYFF
jgi:histone H3/H4